MDNLEVRKAGKAMLSPAGYGGTEQACHSFRLYWRQFHSGSTLLSRPKVIGWFLPNRGKVAKYFRR